MAFSTLVKRGTRGSNLPTRIANTTDVKMAKSANNGSLQISFPSVLLSKVGLAVGDKIDLALGEGEDIGRVLVMKGDTFKLNKDGDKLHRVKFGCSTLLPHVKSLATCVVKHSVIGQAIVIEIPERLRAPTVVAPFSKPDMDAVLRQQLFPSTGC